MRQEDACVPVLTPHGHVRLADARTTEANDIEPSLGKRIRKAFDRGDGHGLFHLGAVEATSTLPPVLSFWRDFGRVFMTALCAVPALEEQHDDLQLEVPTAQLPALVESAPPMTGGEYLSAQVLEQLWAQMQAACLAELGSFKGSVQEFLRKKNPVWNLVGKVHFHLAQQKDNESTPFAFLATYTTRLGEQNKVQHLPLGKALQQYAGARNKAALLALLRPVRTASERSPFLRELADSGSIFHPLGWAPAQAYQFLKDIPAFESSGIVVRVPDWWKSGRPNRPRVQVEVGGKAPGGLGLDALLDFSVDVVLDGARLTAAEMKQILASTDGLALVRGQWVEIDSGRLKEVLQHWKAIEKASSGGVSFLEGMRLLSGSALDAGDAAGGDAQLFEERLEEWSHRSAGTWLAETLDKLQRPESEKLGLEGVLEARLRPYQKVGVSWLVRLGQLGLGACLADDMGLGKTIQVLALLLLLKQDAPAGVSLLVVPASLLGNWRAEIERFAPSLTTLIAHPSAVPSKQLQGLSPKAVTQHDVVITSYASVARLPWAASIDWHLLVLDEAQAIKNPAAKQTRTVKTLRSQNRIVLTGTPVENRLSDLWSLFDFINPGLLGSARAFKTFSKRLEQREHDRYGPLRKLIRPYILRRLKSDRSIISDLPDKTEVRAYCSLTKVQAALYQESVKALSEQLEKKVEGIKRRGIVLAFLTRFKQICNHPSQWLRDGAYAPEHSGKFARLRELCETLSERQEKALVFTQYREMTEPLAAFLKEVFGRPGLVLHGQVAVKKRRDLVQRFQEDESVPFFVLSLKAGGTGLNLTAASQVIHFDRWWNPAVENQATDRAFRIGQHKNVLVHKFVCRGTVEEKIETLIEGKQRMSTELLESGADALLTEMNNDQLLQLVSLDINSALQEA